MDVCKLLNFATVLDLAEFFNRYYLKKILISSFLFKKKHPIQTELGVILGVKLITS
jgi:hypothetical protein